MINNEERGENAAREDMMMIDMVLYEYIKFNSISIGVLVYNNV